MRKFIFFILCPALFLLFNADFCCSADIRIVNISELKTVLKKLKPGDSVKILPGIYNSGIFLKNLNGNTESPITIEGSDPADLPIFEGHGEGLKVSNSSYIKIQNIIFKGFPTNGINIDDGGHTLNPSHHIILENVKIFNIGQHGIHNALKMSGVDHFIVRNCQFKDWGGAGVDLVGCHNGVIEQSSFQGGKGSRTANSIQIKGGSRSILVQNNHFNNSGTRIVQIGGATGTKYFRPPTTDYEAKDVTVAGNTFIGGEAQFSWVTIQDSHVHHNLFYLPHKWLGRILQETKKSRFKPSQKGFFEKNLVVTDQRVKAYFNVGKGTAPETFVFRENLWYRLGGESRPVLPTLEKGGFYGIDPMIVIKDDGSVQINSADPQVLSVGPQAYTPWDYGKDFADVKIPPVIIPEQNVSIWDRVKALVE